MDGKWDIMINKLQVLLLALVLMLSTAAAGSDADLFYYNGDQRVAIHLDLGVVAVETTASASQIVQRSRSAGLAQVSPVTTQTASTTAAGQPRDVLLAVPARSSAELQSLAGRLRTSTGAAAVRAVIRRADGEAPMVVTNQISYQVKPGTDLSQVTGKYNLTSVTPVPFGDHIYTATVSIETDLLAAIKTANAMRASGDFVWATPLIEEKKQPRALWNDPLFGYQWHLVNNGSYPAGAVAGSDMNVAPVWSFLRGTNVNVAINDDGLQMTHPDLSANVRADLSYDFNFDDPDPTPYFIDSHGTACAGLVGAAANNGIGVAGMAPEASLAGLRLLAAATTDLQEARSLHWKATEVHPHNQIHVSSNSWGPPDSGQMLMGPGPLTQAAIEAGASQGRNGKGIVYVWAAGNGRQKLDNINKDGYANNPRVIAVGASTAAGIAASYSEMGAPMLVNAPGGQADIATTDLVGLDGSNSTDYRFNFDGTSAAAPITAGAVALILQANPALTARDVMHILVDTAQKNHSSSPTWRINGAGKAFSHAYGFGRIDTTAAVLAAVNWIPIPEEKFLDSGAIINAPTPIPDNLVGEVLRQVPLEASSRFRVEHVELEINISHPRRGDVVITLESPSGMISDLLPRSNDSSADFSYWRLRSVAHWGENPNGIWKIRIQDGRGAMMGSIDHCQLRIQGHEATESAVANWTLYE